MDKGNSQTETSQATLRLNTLLQRGISNQIKMESTAIEMAGKSWLQIIELHLKKKQSKARKESVEVESPKEDDRKSNRRVARV